MLFDRRRSTRAPAQEMKHVEANVEPGDAKKTTPSPTNAAPVVKRVIVPKHCDVPIHQHQTNIFDPQVCKKIKWDEPPAGSASKPAAVPSGAPGPSKSKDGSTAAPVKPSAEGSQPVTTPGWVSKTLADARTDVVVSRSCQQHCVKMLMEFHNTMPMLIFVDARIGKQPGSYDKFDHQTLDPTYTVCKMKPVYIVLIICIVYLETFQGSVGISRMCGQMR